MAVNGDPAVEAGETFHLGAAEHLKDAWRPGATTTSGARSSLHESFYKDPVIRPAEPFDPSRWPSLY